MKKSLQSGRSSETRGRSSEQSAVLRLWGDIPIVEAKHDVRIVLAPEDGASAIRGDGKNCILAQACKRSFHSSKVVFFRRVAYLELPDEKGRPRVERFCISSEAHNIIRQFDLTGIVPLRASFNLKAPNKTMTLEAHRKYAARYQKELRDGSRSVNALRGRACKRGAKRRKAIVGNHLLRDGHGLLQRMGISAKTA
jgi:hypothetical protein